MIHETFRKKKKFKALIALTIISSLLGGCVKNTSTNTESTEASTETIPDASNKSLSDLFPSDFNEKDNNTNNSLSDLFPSDFAKADNEKDNDNSTYTHTIMVYMVGSDLESRYGNATADLEEMLAAAPDTKNNNIVVFTGGASRWRSHDLEADKSYVLEIKNKDFNIKETQNACNMGNSESLSDFINYCFEEYNTDKYSLILWNHGAGPVVGFGIDENYYDILSLTELQAALDESVEKSGKKLELIGFDACLMSSLEVADALSQYSNYMVASQETEPGWGWDYSFLSKLSKPGMDGKMLGEEIINAYTKYCNTIFEKSPKYYTDITLSCMDLNKYENVENVLNIYFDELNATLSTDTFPEIIRNRSQLRSFGSYSADYNYSMVDSVELAKIMSNDTTSDSAQNLISALDEFVTCNQSNISNANGVSICFPHYSEEIYTEACLKINENIDFSPKYTAFLNNIYSIENGEAIIEEWNVSDAQTNVEEMQVTEGNITSDGNDISLQLTKEQQENFATANFYILANAKKLGYLDNSDDERGEDMYFNVYCGKNVQMDEKGIIHAYYDKNMIYLKDTDDSFEGDISNIPMILTEGDISNTDEKRYTAYVMLEKDNGLYEINEYQNAELQIIRDEKHPDGYIRQAIPLSNSDDEIHTPGKQLIDIYDYDLMTVFSSPRYISTDENGNILPYYEWEKSDWYMGFDTRTKNGLEFVSMPIPDPENYVCMFVLFDSQGNTTASKLIPLK